MAFHSSKENGRLLRRLFVEKESGKREPENTVAGLLLKSFTVSLKRKAVEG